MEKTTTTTIESQWGNPLIVKIFTRLRVKLTALITYIVMIGVPFLWIMGFFKLLTMGIGLFSGIIWITQIGGFFAVFWRLRSITTKASIQTLIKIIGGTISALLSTISALIVAGQFIPSKVELTNLVSWSIIALAGFSFAQKTFRSSRLRPQDYLTFPSFMVRDDRIAFLLPAYNEEASVGEAVRAIKEQFPKSTVLVIDNNSRDNTASVARMQGAITIHESRQGKGNAVKTGFKTARSLGIDALIMMDADCTYKPENAHELLKIASNGGYGIVLGSRLKGYSEKDALKRLNNIGNHMLTFAANIIYGTTHSDICTGYWLFRPETLKALEDAGIRSSGFGLEAEMISLLARKKVIAKDTPIEYMSRKYGKSHLRPFRDGTRILLTLIRSRFRAVYP